jgi:hypothetical protein
MGEKKTEDPHLLSLWIHELKTPLVTIIGFADLLLKKIEDLNGKKKREIYAHLGIVRKNAEKLHTGLSLFKKWLFLRLDPEKLFKKKPTLKETIEENLPPLSLPLFYQIPEKLSLSSPRLPMALFLIELFLKGMETVPEEKGVEIQYKEPKTLIVTIKGVPYSKFPFRILMQELIRTYPEGALKEKEDEIEIVLPL